MGAEGRGETDHRPDLRLAGGLAAAVLAGVGGPLWWALSLRDRLPDPVARHWGASGVADGFSPLRSLLLVHLALSLVLILPIGLAAVLSRPPVLLRRILAGTATFLAVFLGALFADSLRGQLDLADAAAAPLPGPGLLVGTVGGLLAAVAVAALARDVPGGANATAPPPANAVRLPDPASPTTIATRLPGLDRVAGIVAAVAGAVLVGMSVLLSWWLLPLAVLVTALLLATARIHCRIDADGLHAHAFGIRFLHVPIDEVALADIVDVDPFWEFGGWGLRVDVAGRVGLVTRKGPALRIRRGDDSQVLVTLDDAEAAAALLNTLADRQRR